MFCEKCGKELAKGSTFCESCGAQVTKTSVEIPKVLKDNPLKKVSKKFWAIGGAGVIVLAIIVILLVNKKTVINLNDYVTVSFSGYDTMGRATVSLDEEEFLKDYGEKISYKSEDNNNTFFEPAEYVWNLCIAGSLNEIDKLSNGQQVTYSWNCEDELALEQVDCKLKYEDIIFTVEGLEEITVVDLFADVEITYTGVSPEGSAEVKNKSSEELYQSLNYTVEPSEGLSNGDEVTVTVSTYYGDLEEYCKSNFGKNPEATEKKYTVEGLGSYVTSLKDIPEDILGKMKQQAEDNLKAHVANNWDEHEKLDGMTYMGAYLLNAKNPENADVKNMIRLVYKISASDNYEEQNIHQSFEYYYDTTFINLMLLPDGTCSVDLSYYDTPEDNFNREVVVYDSEDDYEYTDGYYYAGYEALESWVNKRVTAFIDDYTYETDMQ